MFYMNVVKVGRKGILSGILKAMLLGSRFVFFEIACSMSSRLIGEFSDLGLLIVLISVVFYRVCYRASYKVF